MSDWNPIAAAIRAGVWADPVTACGSRHDAPRDGSCPCGAVSRHPAAAPVIDREALITAIDELHEATFELFRPEARHLAAALGWTEPDVEPDGEWLVARLNEAIR